METNRVHKQVKASHKEPTAGKIPGRSGLASQTKAHQGATEGVATIVGHPSCRHAPCPPVSSQSSSLPIQSPNLLITELDGVARPDGGARDRTRLSQVGNKLGCVVRSVSWPRPGAWGPEFEPSWRWGPSYFLIVMLEVLTTSIAYPFKSALRKGSTVSTGTIVGSTK
eukprot:1159288-Pelagomonas_calceolata.AAC.3